MDGSLTTDQLVGLLGRLGLAVTKNQLANDIKAGYLPPQPAGYCKRTGRRWSPLSVRRACYLYRLRRIGVEGKLLRVLLFLRDGIGWEEVRPLCMTGIKKMIGVQMSEVRIHFRKKPPRPEELHWYTPDIAERTGILDESLVRFIWGVGYYGRPLPGGSLAGLYRAYVCAFQVPIPQGAEAALVSGLEAALTEEGGGWETLAETVASATEAEAASAASGMRRFLADLRRAVYQQWKQDRTVCPSTNLVTFGGRSADELAAGLRSMPGQLTTAQLLASLLGPMLVTQRLYSAAQAEWAKVSPLLGALLDPDRSEQTLSTLTGEQRVDLAHKILAVLQTVDLPDELKALIPEINQATHPG